MSTFVVFPLDEFNRAFDAACDRLELKKLAETNHRYIAETLERAAIEELHRSFIYELRRLQDRIAKTGGGP